MPQIFSDAIRNQARSSENEIYGWLIGYQTRKIPTVLAIIECNRFEQQTLISAIPHAQEFQEISSMMPQGIGPIGIYHSHPFSSEIFHSHTDDMTLKSLSNQFPNCISLVTNGKEINYYQMNKNNQRNEIDVQFIDPQSPGFLLVSIIEDLVLEVDLGLLKLKDYQGKLRIKILNKIKQYLEDIWEKLEFYSQNTQIIENDSIEQYVGKELFVEPIMIKIPQNLKSIKIKISDNLENSDNDHQNILKLKLISKIPIYITEQTRCFSDIKQAIKTELLSNNILQKIYYSVLNTRTNSIILPNDYYIRYFGFFLRFLYFNNKELNEAQLSSKNFEFFMKFIALFKNLSSSKLDKTMQDYMKSFLVDIEIFSTNFNWKKKFKKIKKELKNKNLN